MSGPLEGLRVIDITQYVAGPYATLVLADLGAEVVKIERPGGDVYRRQGPVFLEGESASFLTLNRGKRSVVLDLREEADREELHGLLVNADVLVENGKPGTMAKFGLGWEDVHFRHPHLVYLSISGFGQEGPDAELGGYDLTIQALSGLMSMTGHPNQSPAKIPVAALDFGTGLYGVVGVLAALRERDRTGEGSWVTTSILESALAWLSMHVMTYSITGEEPQPLGSRSPFFAPYEAYEASDGHIVIVGTGGSDAWGALLGVLGLERLYEDPRFAANGDRVRNAEDLREEIEAVLRTRTRGEWAAALDAAGVPNAPVQRLPDVLRSPQVEAMGILGTIEHPVAGTVQIIRNPVRISGYDTTTAIAPPLLDQDGDALRGAPTAP
jgi:crotonobetainyl-CoA:carnitine CoA-transferase CaiB-like acyl-CoA transferase